MKKIYRITAFVLTFMLFFSCMTAVTVSAEETETPPDSGFSAVLPACTPEFRNTLCWEDVYEYACNDQGTVAEEWPGVKLEPVGKDDYGYDIYLINIYEGTQGIILNNGKNAQTDDITDFSPEGGGYYLDPKITTVNSNGAVVYVPIALEDNTEYYTIGDADSNDTININDVTAIQKYLAMTPVPNTFNVYAADVDQDESVNINDATLIQYFLAGAQRNGSFCNTKKSSKLSGQSLYLDFYDTLGWGNVTVYAFDKNKKILTNAVMETSDYGSCILKIPVETDSLIVVSEDYSKQTVPFSDFWFAGFATFYLAWDKDNSQYVMDYIAWGGLLPEFGFVNSLGWEHVYLEEWDKYGNMIKSDELYSDNNKYTAYPEFNTKKAVITDGNGHKTDYITGFYCVPGDGDVYYLDETKTTVNENGETVYVPIKYPQDDYDCYSFDFTNSLDWASLYVFTWNDEGVEDVAWPGKELTEFTIDSDGKKVYTVKIPQTAKYAIINDGNGKQTVDITDFFPVGKGGYYLDENKISETEYGAIGYIPQTRKPTIDEDVEERVFTFISPVNWDEVYMYAWDKCGNLLAAEYPGTKLTAGPPEGYGGQTFTVIVPEGAAGIILSDGNGRQTDDITDFSPEGGGYRIDENNTKISDYGTNVYVPIPIS
ncbi:MAG: starch-binding protein [Ruminococcus sp.]|nr:starch-binding protein [Ruminococcus sp.]